MGGDQCFDRERAGSDFSSAEYAGCEAEIRSRSTWTAAAGSAVADFPECKPHCVQSTGHQVAGTIYKVYITSAPIDSFCLTGASERSNYI